MNASNPFRTLTVFAAGGAHIDRRGRSAEPFRVGASNPGRVTETVGGATFNAVRALRALGAIVRLVSPRGGDPDAARVETALRTLGVEDMAVTWLDRQTPTYTALLDRDGDLVGGLADMALYGIMRPRVFDRRHIREALGGSDMVLLDANLPAETVERLVDGAGGKPVFAIAVSPAKVAHLAPALSRFDGSFLSRAEAASVVNEPVDTAFAAIVERLAVAGCRRAVVTDGGGAAAIIDDSRIMWQKPPAVSAIRDVTGAGDTLAAVTALAFAGGIPFASAARMGIAAASLHIAQGRRDGELTANDITTTAAALPPATSKYPNDRTEPA